MVPRYTVDLLNLMNWHFPPKVRNADDNLPEKLYTSEVKMIAMISLIAMVKINLKRGKEFSSVKY